MSYKDCCPCGGTILADTEDWPIPLCNSCYEKIESLSEEFVHQIMEDAPPCDRNPDYTEGLHRGFQGGHAKGQAASREYLFYIHSEMNAHNNALRAENKRLRDALEFYADTKYCWDYGERARKALGDGCDT